MRGVYCIKNIITNRVYIGSSINCRKRILQHFADLKRHSHGNKNMQDDFNANNGWLVGGVIEQFTGLNLISREQSYIDNTPNLYNICMKADSSLGVKRREETRERVREANSGLKHPEWRNKIKSKAQGGKNHWTHKKDIPFSDESRKKMSDTHKRLYANGYKHPNTIPVYQYSINGDFIKGWESAAAAARNYNCTSDAIRNCMDNKSKTSKGFVWKRKKI